MDSSQLQLETWESLADDARLLVARQLAEQLPTGFSFNRLETHESEGQRHPVAFFDWKPTFEKHHEWYHGTFALIPGATATLGYERGTFVPTPEQQKSWNGTRQEYGVPELEEYLDGCMTPLRTVEIKPFLMEVKQIETECLPVPVSEWDSDSPPKYVSDAIAKGKDIVTVFMAPSSVAEQSRKHGFRLPTSDEWEWACAAGSRTLWRWGDDFPINVVSWRTEDELKHTWHLHRLPNAFGLNIAFDDYFPDDCEGNITRGGDGGGNSCGGAGALASWLTLASSYFQREQRLDNPDVTAERGTRRVFPMEHLF